MRKTTKAARKIIEAYTDALRRHELAVINAIENPTSSTKSMDWYNGLIEGMLVFTNNTLHQMGCYHGFYYVDENGQPFSFSDYAMIQQHPSFREHRVGHNIKD